MQIPCIMYWFTCKATSVQAAQRGKAARVELQEQHQEAEEAQLSWHRLQAATTMQAAVRGRAARRGVEQQQQAATRVQAAGRGRAARKGVAQRRAAATRVQAAHRGRVRRKELQEHREAESSWHRLQAALHTTGWTVGTRVGGLGICVSS